MWKHAIGWTALVTGLAAVAFAIRPAHDDAPKSNVSAERGRYIVNAFGCADCHTPLVLGPSGLEPDASMQLAGHPQTLVMPPAPELPPGPWTTVVAGTNTAWSGPWGVSFTANLTPDPETGLGRWTEQDFVTTLRTGRHLGRGREILPPMPWPMIRNLNDDDLKSVFAYLRALPPIQNRVPNPIAPALAAEPDVGAH
jgi:mono/diheme cytochrome c family protein